MRDAQLLWTHLFGDQRGYLCLAHRAPTGVVHDYYTWPDECQAAARRALELGAVPPVTMVRVAVRP